MPLPPPRFAVVHGVFGFATLPLTDLGRDERFIAEVATEFPNVVSRQILAAEAPPSTPYLTLASTSSQLALSAVQADFEVRFYGDYVEDVGRALDYVERKLSTILQGFEAVGRRPAIFGLVSTVHFSFAGVDVSPAVHVLRNHLRAEVDESELQDALARVAVGIRDTYFVTLTVSNYETRIFERPLLPALQTIRVMPGEGRVEDVGLELAIDINNNLEARTSPGDVVVTEAGLRATLGILREIIQTSGPVYAETGRVSVPDLTLSSAP